MFELNNKKIKEGVALALGVGVSVAYAGQHLDHLGTIAEGVRMGYVIPGMLSVIAFYAAKSAFSEREKTNARVISSTTALVVAVVSVNISARAMAANDLKAVTEFNRVALVAARIEYDQQEVIRMSQFSASIENGKAAKFAEKSSFLDEEINMQREAVNKARSTYNRWDYKLSKGSKQSKDTQKAWESSKADLEKERVLLTELIDRKSTAMSGAITTAETYQSAVFVEPEKKKTDPFIWTYAGTIEAYLFFIAFMFRERKEKKLNLLDSKSDEKVKLSFTTPCFTHPSLNTPSFTHPFNRVCKRVGKRVCKRVSNEIQTNNTDVAFNHAKAEAEKTLKALQVKQQAEDMATKKEQCLKALMAQKVGMKKDQPELVDKKNAEDECGFKAAEYAFKKAIKTGYLLAAGRGRGRQYRYPEKVTMLVTKKG